MKSFNVIYLTGAPATGKSTLTNMLINRVNRLKVISYGNLLKEYMHVKTGQHVTHEKLREQSANIIQVEDIIEVDKLLINSVNNARTSSNVVIDSHPVTKEEFGFRVTAFSNEMLNIIQPTLIICLYAEPSVIIERIKQANEGRRAITEHESNIHNWLQASVAINYSINSGAPAYFLDSNSQPEDIASVICKKIDGR